MNINKTYFGYTDQFNAMQKAKRENTLDKLYRFEIGVMSEKEFIYKKLQTGSTPEIEENYSYYSSRTGEMTKPKTLYKLSHGNNTYNEITKTAYEFALHVLDNNLLDETIAANYIQEEQHQKAELERLEKEKELKERQEREEKARIQREKDQAERQEKIRQWNELGEQLFTNEIEEKLVIILNKYWNKLIEMFPKTERESFYMDMNKKFITMLGNINYCKYWSKIHLEETENIPTIESNPSRIIEREFLFSVFDIKETDHANTVNAKINAFYNNREYKGSKPVIEHTFYYYNNQEQKFIEAEGQKVNIEGYTCFIRTVDNGYIITEAKTGLGLGGVQTSKKAAIEKAKENVQKAGKERMDNIINNTIERYGISPLYKEVKTA